eukprot:s2539_g9.t1
MAFSESFHFALADVWSGKAPMPRTCCGETSEIFTVRTPINESSGNQIYGFLKAGRDATERTKPLKEALKESAEKVNADFPADALGQKIRFDLARRVGRNALRETRSFERHTTPAVAVAVEPAVEGQPLEPVRDVRAEHAKDADAHGKVIQQDSPRNHVLPEALPAELADAGPIVWPGAVAEAEAEAEECEPVPEPAVPVERQRRPADVSHAAPPAEEVPVYTPARAGPATTATEATPEMPLLQNEAGSLVVPQTWRFVPPPPEQAPKPCYDKVLEAKAAGNAPTAATATPPREDATPSAREDLTPKKLIEDLVQDQVKLDLRDKQLLVEQLVECLIDQVKRYEKELGAEQRANRALKMSLEVEQRKTLMYHQRLSELAQQLPLEAQVVFHVWMGMKSSTSVVLWRQIEHWNLNCEVALPEVSSGQIRCSFTANMAPQTIPEMNEVYSQSFNPACSLPFSVLDADPA